MREWKVKKLTTKENENPLIYVHFDLEKLKSNGNEVSCELMVHPKLKEDEHVVNQLSDLVKYIRENYNLEDLT